MTYMLGALRFLTILPLGRGRELSPQEMAGSMAYFPAAGIVLGLALAAADFLLSGLLPAGVVDVLVVGLLALVTGGFHLDGFADTLDGLYGGRGDKERTLAIMKDSSVGAMGVIGLALLLMLKVAALGGIAGGQRATALVMMTTLSRWAQVRIAFGALGARKQGSLAAPFVEHLKPRHLLMASATALAASLAAYASSGPAGIIALAAVAVTALCARYYFNRKIGGVTGDVIGATSETSEVVVVLVFLLTG